MRLMHSLAFAACLSINTNAQSTFSPARPPAIPLAVRNPYVSAWLKAGSDGVDEYGEPSGGNGGYLAGEWASFWSGQVLGWTGLIKVDGVTYVWMGEPENLPAALVNQTTFSYTSTRSTFTMNVNNIVGMTIEFQSPVLPNDTLRSSFSTSYMNVYVVSLDDADHDIQLYTDISAEWVSGDRNDIAQWSYGTTTVNNGNIDQGYFKEAESPIKNGENEEFVGEVSGGQIPLLHRTNGLKSHSVPLDSTPSSTETRQTYFSLPRSDAHKLDGLDSSYSQMSTINTVVIPTGVAYHQIFRQTPLQFGESFMQAEWGNWYYATANVTNLTYACGVFANDVRNYFVANGSLTNTVDTNYRAINDSYPIFAYAIDLGTISTTPVSTLFTIQLAQEDVIQFEGTNGNETLPGIWTSYFSNDLDAVAFFYSDYATASSLTSTLDDMVATESIAAAGGDYLTITALSVRQAYGGLQMAGTPTTPYIFLKEISSDGNINTVDVIFPLHPILLYMNATWLKLLLEPLFINQRAGYWPNQYSIHDLGNNYPNATGHNDGTDEMQPLEECGNMIIMTLAYAQRANDNAYLSANYNLLRQWNNYLIEEALIPANQISTDDFAGPLANQTNLAIKGIIGIGAMAQIANRTGNTADYLNFTQIAQNYITQWQGYAVDTNATVPHTTLNYGNASTYSLLYNLYTDRELGLNLVPQSVYDMQSAFYPTVEQGYGVPLDTRHVYTKMDWQLLCAAVASNATQQMFVSAISNWIDQTSTGMACTDWYNANNGTFPIQQQFYARPVVGGNFGILALLSAPGAS